MCNKLVLQDFSNVNARLFIRALLSSTLYGHVLRTQLYVGYDPCENEKPNFYVHAVSSPPLGILHTRHKLQAS